MQCDVIDLRKARERGHANHGWLDTFHTFSFADYFDPGHMGFRSLRVINEDRVAPGRGFGAHGHRDMEIITYVVEGVLEHKDNMRNGSLIRPGDVQRISAGTGVVHSEFNPSAEEPTHFLQIWILPEETGLAPSYEQKTFADDTKRGRLRLVASRGGRDDSVAIHQDADLYASVLSGDESVRHTLGSGRHAWLQVVAGEVTLNGEGMSAGDGAAVSGEPSLAIASKGDRGEILLFDLA